MASPEPIAVVGSGCRFPGGVSSPSGLWSLLKEPRNVASRIPSDRFNIDAFYHPDSKHHGTTNVQESYFLSQDIRRFDAPFFNISAREAESIDPQQRVLLESVYEAVERAGLRPAALQGSQTGVFCGVMCDDFSQILARDTDQLPQYTSTGIARNNISNRVSYFFNWHGPSMTIDTACSSSLVAVHLAVQAIRDGSCTVAVASGTNLIMSPIFYMSASKLNMLSPTGRSRMWDASADGYARGEGVASVVLKKLSDAIADGDPIECIIRETNVNQDGRTMGITMPSSAAQAQLIRSTYAKAGLRLDRAEDRCQYFEAHGTGTQAGDPQEAGAIAEAFFSGEGGSDIAGEMLVGSVKTVIGHTEGTAGIAGLLKASLCLQNSTLVPNLHFNNLSPKVKPFYSNLRIPTTLQPWPQLPPGIPRRASVNSFGFGGTNAHVILESYERNPGYTNGDVPGPATEVPLPYVFSASSDRSLGAVLESYSRYLDTEAPPSYVSLAESLCVRRDDHAHKVVLYASSNKGLKLEVDRELERRKAGKSQAIVRRPDASQKRVLGIFTGQGAQWPGMGHDIISASPAIRGWVEQLQDSLDQLPLQYRPQYSLMEELSALPERSRLSQAAISQPVCTALQIVLVNLLRSVGIAFSAVVGHSSGEIAAAYAAGFVSASDAIRIAHLRGKFAKLAGANAQGGGMLAAGLSMDEARDLCEQDQFRGRITVAAFNSPQSVTLSGDADAVLEAAELLKTQGKFARLLKVDTAYHSHHMIRCSNAYIASLKEVGIKPRNGLEATWFSSVNPGQDMNNSCTEPLKDVYWNDNMLKSVHFTQSVTAAVTASSYDLIIEVGPHPALKGPFVQTISDIPGTSTETPYLGLLKRGGSGLEAFASALGSLWIQMGPDYCNLTAYTRLLGSHVDSSALKSMPTYPFDHTQSYWGESRLSKALAHRTTRSNLLLGTQNTDAPDGDWRWRNYLRREEIEWLDGHQIESQTVFPATGYVAMALEAASIVAGDRSLRMIEICDFHVTQAISFDENSSAGVEVLFKLENVQTSESNMSATFACHAAFGGTLRRCAYGNMEIAFGSQERSLLPGRGPQIQALNDITVDDFYSYLKDIGYGYTGLFRSITAFGRKRDTSSGLMLNTSRSDTASSLLMHPATMDTLLQTLIGAIGAPYDGRVYTLLVPTMISRIIVNPLLGGKTGMSEEIAFDTCLTEYGPSNIRGDVALFDLDGNCALQMEGVRVSPLSVPTAADDRLMFSETIWRPLQPDATQVYAPMSPEAQRVAELKEEAVLVYMKQIRESLTPEEVASLDWHGAKIVGWFDHVLHSVQAGSHPVFKKDCLDKSISEIMAELDESTVEVEAVRLIGENMTAFLRGGKPIPEVLREHNILNRFYKDLTNTDIVEQTASVAAQLSFRYPRMKILEIGAGTGTATGAILDNIGRSYHSYTYTDISAGFFEDAQELFKEHSDRFIYKVLDIEKSPKEQGFEEHSYDLIVAANVLHATVSLQETLVRVRSLLKPGGSLLLQEGTNTDIVLGSFIFAGFENWWLGEADGRVWGPMATADVWDRMLKTAGFSGVDTITPDHDTGLRPFSVFLSQAVDAKTQLLRDPFTPSLVAKPPRGILHIIGGATDPTLVLVTKLEAILSPFFEQIVVAHTLESPELQGLASMVTTLSLTDLDGPCFRDVSEPQYETLKRVFDASHRLLWVTAGSESENPYDGMSKGLLACAGYENPSSQYQHFNIVDSDALQADVIATQLMRMEVADADNDHTLADGVWATESEIRLEGGKLWISRVRNNSSMNMRYMSERRSIEEEVDIQEESIGVAESGEMTRVTKPKGQEECGSTTLPVRVRFSTSAPFRFEGAGLLYLVIGVGQETNGRLLVLSESRESIIMTKPGWCWPVPQHVSADDESAYLYRIVSALLAANLVNMASPKSTILVHEADNIVRAAIATSASAAGIRPIFTTSKQQRDDQMGPSTVFVHEMSSTRALASILPVGCVSVAARFDCDSGTTCGGVWSRVQALLPTNARQENLLSLRCSPSVLSAIWGVTSTAASLEVARHQANESRTAGLGISVVDCQSLADQKGLQIVDWTQITKVQIKTQPASSLVNLSPNKTYLLVGMTGDLGRSVCRWMIGRGARYLVLTSRNPKVEQWWIEDMARLGGNVVAMAM